MLCIAQILQKHPIPYDEASCQMLQVQEIVVEKKHAGEFSTVSDCEGVLRGAVEVLKFALRMDTKALVMRAFF